MVGTGARPQSPRLAPGQAPWASCTSGLPGWGVGVAVSPRISSSNQTPSVRGRDVSHPALGPGRALSPETVPSPALASLSSPGRLRHPSPSLAGSWGGCRGVARSVPQGSTQCARGGPRSGHSRDGRGSAPAAALPGPRAARRGAGVLSGVAGGLTFPVTWSAAVHFMTWTLVWPLLPHTQKAQWRPCAQRGCLGALGDPGSRPSSPGGKGGGLARPAEPHGSRAP